MWLKKSDWCNNFLNLMRLFFFSLKAAAPFLLYKLQLPSPTTITRHFIRCENCVASKGSWKHTGLIFNLLPANKSDAKGCQQSPPIIQRGVFGAADRSAYGSAFKGVISLQPSSGNSTVSDQSHPFAVCLFLRWALQAEKGLCLQRFYM